MNESPHVMNEHLREPVEAGARRREIRGGQARCPGILASQEDLYANL